MNPVDVLMKSTLFSSSTFAILAFSLDVATDGMIYGRAKLSNIFERTNTESSEVTENVQEESKSSNEESSNDENTNNQQGGLA